jgi:hypothetical protein
MLLLTLALLRGLTYLALFPPWQHYDEPTHFEYVRLIAQRRQLPSPGDVDLEMRVEIAASMQAADFWKGMEVPQIEFWSDEPAWIGISELRHPPLYYAFVALPQVIAAHQSVEVQLYLARLVSVLLDLVVIGAAYGLVAELFPDRRLLPLAVAAFIAFHSPFTDVMSAVNNDAGAAAAGSLLLWFSVRMVRRGFTLQRAAIVVLLCMACIGIKSTSSVVAVVTPLALGAGYLARWRPRWLMIGLGVAIPVSCIALFTVSGHAAHWYSSGPATARNRVATETPSGNSALRLGLGAEERPQIVFQELERSVVTSLRGEEVSYGAWLRAGEGSGGSVALELVDGIDKYRHQVHVTDEWQFYAFSTTIDPQATGVAAYVILPDEDDAAQTAYADGLVLAKGSLSADGSLAGQNEQGTITLSGGEQVPNLLRNASAERTWPALRTWIGKRTISGVPLSMAFHSLWEWTRTGWVYLRGGTRLFKGFWGVFAWHHLSMGTAYFWIAGLVTAGSALGTGLWLVRLRRSRGRLQPWQRHALGVLGVVLAASWFGAMIRIHPVFTTRYIYWPVARYAIPVMVLTSVVLCFGLSELVPRRLRTSLAWLGLLAWIAADAVALLTVIVPYYYG